MKSIKQALSKYKSTYAAAEANDVHAKQLDRLKDKGALVDDNGQVWIKSKTVLPDCKAHKD